MKDTPKALFLDIDGTLIWRDKGPFIQDIAQIQEARKQGHRIFLNTGRSWANIPPVFLHAPYVDGMITGSGAHVLLNGKTMYHTWIPEETLTQVCDLYTNNQKWCVFEGETDIYGINRYDPRFFIRPSEFLSSQHADRSGSSPQ
jgi:hydroxymethylpyrimidine pyrophosphatase-like HAD family hydrolase